MLEAEKRDAPDVIEERGILDQESSDSPVQKPLKSIMKIDFIVNEKGQVWFCYDRPLPDLVQWIEYDLDLGRVTFVFRGGKMADYGEEIEPEVRTYLKKAESAYLVYMKDKKIEDMGVVKLIVRRPLN